MKKEEKEAKFMYDRVAEFYHYQRLNKNPDGQLNGQFYNASIEMPGMLKALGNVKGKKILDWGCGSGIYLKVLTSKGAKVKGFDISSKMVEIAKENNPKLDLRVGSGLKIPFNEKFDIVFASLSIHYLENWNKAFKEVSRVLNKNGVFIFSIINPVKRMSKGQVVNGKEYRLLGIKDYFKEGEVKYDWDLPNGERIVIPQYHKTCSTITKIIIQSGFEIISFEELKPLKESKNKFPELYELYSKFPNFVLWKVKKR